MYALQWTEEARKTYDSLRERADKSHRTRAASGKRKAGKVEGLFKQVHKTVEHLATNPRHPGLKTHVYKSLQHPFDADGKVFEAYVQHRTPGAYRVFWCYGPEKGQITIIAITPHP